MEAMSRVKVNLAKWAKKAEWSGQTGEWYLTYEWQEPRDITGVEIIYEKEEPQSEKRFDIEYWQKAWPIPNPERLKGARRGWIEQDDPYNGNWVKVRRQDSVNRDGRTCYFAPLDIAELPELSDWAEDYNVRFRRSLKLRLVYRTDERPAFASVIINSSASYQEKHILVTFRDQDNFQGIEVTNGECLDVGRRQGCVSLKCLVSIGSKAQGDQTLVTIVTDKRTFTFSPMDLEKGAIWIPDYGVKVKQSPDVSESCGQNKSIYSMVNHESEQTYLRATQDIPHLDVTKQAPYGRYVILGWEGVRQEFALRYNGEIFSDKRQAKMSGRDTAKVLWPGQEIHFRFGSGDPVDFRQRAEGSRQRMLQPYLPVYETQWIDRELEFTQTSFAFVMNGPVVGPDNVKGDEELAVAVRFKIRNTTEGDKRALLWLDVTPSEKLELKDECIIATGRVVPDSSVKDGWKVQDYEEERLRLCITKQKGDVALATLSHHVVTEGLTYEVRYHEHFGETRPELHTPASVPSTVLYSVELASNDSVQIDVVIPYSTYICANDWRLIRDISYDEKLAEVTAHWQSFYEKAAKLYVPEPVINDFIQAVPWHVLVTADRDPVTGHYILPAATYRYGACGNEACMQIRMLDMLGYHDYARLYLETFLSTQGMKGLDGDFASQDGVLTSIDFDDGEPVTSMFSYNLDHGFILATLIDHYCLTGDTEWLRSISEHLIDACEFVIRERNRQESGLLPPGHLEDNREWEQWFAVNAHAFYGMKRTAEALTEIAHNDSPRIAEEVEKYRKDILHSLQYAMDRSPVVPLRDGTYVPHIPTYAGLRGRSWGWFREAAYGPLHLSQCEVLDVNDSKTTWILKDLEDNLFVTRQYGRPVDLQNKWFSQGGVTIQSNLLPNGPVYLRRNQVKHAVRALFNNFCQSIYRDVLVFTEHPVIELGHGVGPFFKTPDEAEFIVWLRNYLVREVGKDLWIGQGIPREWMEGQKRVSGENLPTKFGLVSFNITPDAINSDIVADITCARSDKIGNVVLYLRHPQESQITSFSIEGATGELLSGESIVLKNITGHIHVTARYA